MWTSANGTFLLRCETGEAGISSCIVRRVRGTELGGLKVKIALVIKYFGFETGLFWGKKKSRFDIIKLSVTLLTIGVELVVGF